MSFGKVGESEEWTVDSGQWTVDSEQWTVDSGFLQTYRNKYSRLSGRGDPSPTGET